jgi:hypothetical protein
MQRGQTGDRKIGVIWHTQGSGKSLLMAFFGGLVVRSKELENPTLPVHPIFLHGIVEQRAHFVKVAVHCNRVEPLQLVQPPALTLPLEAKCSGNFFVAFVW